MRGPHFSTANFAKFHDNSAGNSAALLSPNTPHSMASNVIDHSASYVLPDVAWLTTQEMVSKIFVDINITHTSCHSCHNYHKIKLTMLRFYCFINGKNNKVPKKP